MNATPVILNLINTKSIIIGGGAVAEKRARTLVEEGSQVKVISPGVTTGIKTMAVNKDLIWIRKSFSEKDLIGAFIVVIATNNATVNEEVLSAAKDHPLVNFTSDGERGNLQFPSLLTKGRLKIAISTGGASPKLAALIKKDLEKKYDDRYEQYIDFLYECRQFIKCSSWEQEVKSKLLSRLLDEEFLNVEKQKEMSRVLQQAVEGGAELERTYQ
ncbi:NAD(P)-binding protein [Halobacillus yeomjeoni]|uniref:precorrin-2 dehydrogenase n=1 Tax=Halobacillus yeomjeoni TaxID=311194 RepID=A0A931HU25_9BACI|nr:NAD(P)-binding protein [Halobacillus yeomjeoni]MBH0229461.1 NAD(P)-binding protein [Halobacillus yeomjeoni]